jgi:hypothetical protein
MTEDWQDEINQLLTKFTLQNDLSLREFFRLCELISVHKFGGDDNPEGFWKDLGHIHSEASEVWDERRDGRAFDETYFKKGKPEGIPTEMADVVIKTVSMCGESRYGIPLITSLCQKLIWINNNKKVKNARSKV